MLFETYAKLVSDFPRNCDGLFGSEVVSRTGLWLSVDQQGNPSLLFPADPADIRSDIALRFIDVEFSRDCHIARKAGEAFSGTFTLIRLNESDTESVRLFLKLLEESICQIRKRLDNRELGNRILALAELFSRIEDARGDILGLWGELYIVAGAGDIENAARCWCLHKSARFDFVADAFAIEVKTTLKKHRVHRFSLDQLRPTDDVPAVVASIQLAEAYAGKTVAEMIDSILERIDDQELRTAFFNLCAAKGGKDLYRSEMRLQPLPDERTIALFRAKDIPVPQIDVGAPISNVRFDVDLSGFCGLDDIGQSEILAFDKS